MNLSLIASEENLDETIRVLQHFEENTGLKLIYEKIIVYQYWFSAKYKCTFKNKSTIVLEGISLLGKILILNSLVVSLFIYKMNVLLSINEREIYSIMQDFIWNNHKSKISLETLMLDKRHGGLRLMNVVLGDKILKIN